MKHYFRPGLLRSSFREHIPLTTVATRRRAKLQLPKILNEITEFQNKTKQNRTGKIGKMTYKKTSNKARTKKEKKYCYIQGEGDFEQGLNRQTLDCV